jgi:LacI family transcriptional regulator
MRRSDTFAVLVHDIRDPYFSECARGVTDAAEAAGYLTMICNSDRDPATELRYLDLLQSHRVAGVLFAGGGFEDPAYRKRVRHQIEAMRDYGGYAITLGPRAERMPGEIPDNRDGARQATAHLLELGHERIGFVAGPPKLRTSTERLAGHRDALEAAGLALDPSLVAPGHFSEEGGAEATRLLLERDPRVSAIFAANDAMALGALQAITARGLRVPDEVSLVGFDDVSYVRWLDPPLTTVRVPMRELGRRAVTRLLTFLRDEDGIQARRVNVHPLELVVRQSTAPPPRRGSGSPRAR